MESDEIQKRLNEIRKALLDTTQSIKEMTARARQARNARPASSNRKRHLAPSED